MPGVRPPSPLALKLLAALKASPLHTLEYLDLRIRLAGPRGPAGNVIAGIVRRGFAEIVGETRDGEPVYRLTREGLGALHAWQGYVAPPRAAGAVAR